MIKYFEPQLNQQISDHFFKTSLPGLLYFETDQYADERGFFSEVVKLPELETVIGHEFKIKQINHAHSEMNVIRGMHAEGWNKLVTVTTGLVFSAIADIRPESPTYKQVEYFKLGSDQKLNKSNGLYITQGLANSVAVLQGPVSYIYLVDKLYEERDEKGDQAISIFDKELNIEWPIDQNQMIISKRDKQAIQLENIDQV